MTVAVVTFPGSNCDRDCLTAVRDRVGVPVVSVWHKDHTLHPSTTAVILPGGFSYGDYLRTGAMAALSPITAAVRRFAEAGGPVLGICNGFQILCETRLLPGALRRNADGLFRCEDAVLEVTGDSPLLAGYRTGQRIVLPIAHGEGNYTADDATLDALDDDGRVAFRYVARTDAGHGRQNGSRRAVAGLVGGPARNVLGLMPHPERRVADWLQGSDGLPLLTALAKASVTSLARAAQERSDTSKTVELITGRLFPPTNLDPVSGWNTQ